MKFDSGKINSEEKKLLLRDFIIIKLVVIDRWVFMLVDG